MQAASDVTNGTIVHYSSAGSQGSRLRLRTPTCTPIYRDPVGEVHEFDSLADGLAAKKAGDPPIARGDEGHGDAHAQYLTSGATSLSKGTRSGRHIGDCESKLYLQTRLLTEAGFTLDRQRGCPPGRRQHRPHVRRLQGAGRQHLGDVERKVRAGARHRAEGSGHASRSRFQRSAT